MPKIACSCNDDSQKEFINETETFRTHYFLDSTFIPIFKNPARQLRELVRTTNQISLVDRANCLSCDDNISTEDKLKVRKKNRPTPYRVPYNHFRKVTSCDETCDTNVTVIKDLSCAEFPCPVTNYAISRLVDKNGVRNLNNGSNYKNYLQSRGKNYYLNTFGILPENSVDEKIHTYKIGAIENTVNNYNSGTSVNTNCKLQYSTTTSLTDKSFTLSKINTTTKKYSNPTHRTSGSVSSRAHIHRKKFKNRLAAQITGKDGYNNCRNGSLCTLYMAPGPNTKLFMGKSAKQRCIPPRIRGMKQSCPVPPINTQLPVAPVSPVSPVSPVAPLSPVTPIVIVTPTPPPTPPSAPSTLTNLSLLPFNFLGGNRSIGGIGEDTDQFKNPCVPWERTVPYQYGYNEIVDYSYNVILKFTLEDDISSGDTIKLTMKRPPDTSEINDGPIFYDDTWPINGPPFGNYGNYIELKSGSTPKDISSVSLGTFVSPFPGTQEIILTIKENISASDITINFFNQGFDNWQENAKDGTPLTFDLEVTGHTTSTNNLGWYSQDITARDTLGDTTLWHNNNLFCGQVAQSPFLYTTFIYRHYSPIPENSRIRLIFRVEHVKDGYDDKYIIFKTDSDNGLTFSDATGHIANYSTITNTPSTKCGISVKSKDLQDATTNNNISIGSFVLGGIKKSNFVASESGEYPNTNYGSIEYLEFTVTENGGISGDTPPIPNNTISSGNRYIEININMRNEIANYLYTRSSGKVHYSIQVFDPNNILIGGAYNLENYSAGAFTVTQGG